MYKKNNGLTEQEKLQNKFSAYIETTIVRYRMTYLRYKSRNYIGLCENEEEFESIPDTTDFVYDMCSAECISNALKSLNEKERYVFVSKVIEERDFNEIAETMGMKYKGVTTLYYRAIAKLKTMLEGMYENL